MKENTRTIGFEVEQKAREYLEKRGLVFKECNFQCVLGEIDLIMQDGEFLVFVEVRFRDDHDYGGAIATISRGKQTKIIRTAKWYLLEKDLYDKVFCRFDVITGETLNGELSIDWIKSAFTENFI